LNGVKTDVNEQILDELTNNSKIVVENVEIALSVV